MIFSVSMKRPSNEFVFKRSASVALSATLVLGSLASADDWPFVRNDLCASGVAKGAISDDLDVLWRYPAGGDGGFEATAIVADGVAYVGDNEGTFHAVRLTDGKAAWTKQFEDSGFMAGAAFDRGRLYVGDANGVVRCLSAADGSEQWPTEAAADVEGEVYAGPTVVENDVLVTCEAGSLTCFNAESGQQRWRFEIDAPLRCMPTIVAGHVLLAGCDSQLHFIEVSTGKETGTVPIDAPTGSTAAVLGNRVFFGTEGGTFFAIDAATNKDQLPAVAWTYRDEQRGQPIRSAAAVTDKLLVYGAQGKMIYGLTPTGGQLEWKLPTRSRVDSSPVIVGERVVAATDRGVVYLLDATNKEVKWQFDAGGGFAASPAVVDGRIILGNTDGTLYCFGQKNSD